MEKILLTAEQHDALGNLNISALNAMQQRAVEHCRDCRNMVLLSPTGTGKTLAYLLPLLERLDVEAVGMQALVVLPSRELAKQVAEVWRLMRTPFRVTALYGGRPVTDEAAMLQGAQPSVVVGTPGRLIDHLTQGNLSSGACRLLVIDEFDKCLEMGFREEMEKLLSLLPDAGERWLLSATDAEEIPCFVAVDDGEKLDFREGEKQPVARTQFYKVTTTPQERLAALHLLLSSFRGEPSIVFCNFRESVDEVRKYLATNGMQVVAYHGALEQKQRELALYRFKSGCVNTLISTDLAARGLDIKDVKHIVHFQRAMTADVFTHRNGRTARWEAAGAVYMITYEERELPEFVPERVEEYRLPTRPLRSEPAAWSALYVGKGKKDKISRGDLAGFFMKKGHLKADEVGDIVVYEHHAYVAIKRNRMREVISLVAGEKIKGIKTIFEPVRG